MSEEQVDAAKITAAMAKFKFAKGAIVDSSAALLKGARALGEALSHDMGTGVAKIMGNYADYGVAQGYVQARRYMTSAYASDLGRHLPKLTPEQEASFAGRAAAWTGSPRDLAVILGAGFGAGSYFRLADKSAASAINPMADYLASLQLPFVSDARTVVAGLVAITCYTAVRVFVDFRGMENAATFERRREESAADVNLFSQYLGDSTGTHASVVLADLARSAQKAYDDSFGSLPRFSGDGLALVRSLRSSGAPEAEIVAALAQDFHEDARLADQVSRTLADDYLMPSAQAGKVAVDLVLLHEGDTPLLRNRLASRVLPPGWVTQFGFDPQTVVGEMRLKNRPSETAKLFASTLSRVTEKFGQQASVPGEKGGLGPKL